MPASGIRHRAGGVLSSLDWPQAMACGPCARFYSCFRMSLMSQDAFICDAIRTPFGRYGGALSAVRADELGAVPMHALMQRNPQVDWARLDDVIYGCANQAGEDNRNVARMSALLAGLPVDVPGVTLNRLCG